MNADTCTCTTRTVSGVPVTITNMNCPEHTPNRTHIVQLGADDVEVVRLTLTRQAGLTMAQVELRDRTSGAYLIIPGGPVVFSDAAPAPAAPEEWCR